jgi:DNA polymerase-3 subunit alpha
MEDIKFVGLHAHCGAGSPFDGFGFPQDHMDYAHQNGCEALALTDHGNMNGLAYQVQHAKKMMKNGKDFKPIFGVEAYFIEDVDEWKLTYDQWKEDKKKRRQLDDQQSGTTIENEGETKGKSKNEVNRSRHIVLLAMNQEGLQNIFKLISESYSGKYFYRKPRIDYNLLKQYGGGVIASSACLGGVYAGCYWENREEGEEAVLRSMRQTTEKMLEVFGDRWYGELQWNNVPEQHELNKYVIQMNKEYGLGLISTADSHYPTPEAWKDRELYKRLGWLGKGKPEWLDMNLPTSVQEMDYELYPKNGQQMWESYRKYSKMCGVKYDDELVKKSLEETYRIAFERIDGFMPNNTVRLPNFVVPAGISADDYLRQLTLAGLADLFKKKNKTPNQIYLKRLRHELGVIADRGFSKYFLTMKAISDKTNEIQLSGPARGSAAGSLVAYALGITQVDPIRYGLLFSRFLRSDATDYPDIDYDVSDPMILKESLIGDWGDNVVVPISNWNTLQLRSLIKDVSKFYGIEFKEVNQVTNNMLFEATPLAKQKHGIKAGVYTPTFDEVMEFSESLQKFLKKYPNVKEHVEALHGQYRSCSRHAGGVVIGEDLDKHMPLISSKGIRQTPWSEGQNVRQLEPMGFIKFDILGLSTLRMIEDCITKILQRHHGIDNPTFQDVKNYYDKNLHPDVMDLNNQEVYSDIFHKGKWAGIFQFTESGAQRFAMQVKPRSIIDLAAITSIYRPGPLSAEVDKSYVSARENPDEIKYLNDVVRDVTQETYGFLIFQEQIAILAHKLGKNVSLDEGNLLRKVLTKKGTGKGHEVKEQIREKFIEGCIDKRIQKKKAEVLWKTFEYFSGYGFNKSHAISYSIISYQCAYLCKYYTTEWMAAFLDKEPETRKEKAINLAKQHGYQIKPLNINYSEMTWKIIDDETLVAPLTTIKGLGEKAIDQILLHRPFNTVEELLFNEEVIYSKFNKKALDVLCRAGAIDDLIDDRFTGDKHFWYATCVDRPRNIKKLAENIDKYKTEGSFTEEERIEFIADLTGIFPMSMVLTEDVHRRLNELCVPAISEFDPDLMICWCIPRSVTLKKTRNGKSFYVVEVIDSNSVTTRIRCWSVNKDKDKIYLNRPYMIKPRYNDQWGFSTYGRVDNSWRLLG